MIARIHRLLALLLLLVQGSIVAYSATPLMSSHCECLHGADVDCDCPHHAGAESNLPPCHRHAGAKKAKPPGFRAKCGSSRPELQLLPAGFAERTEWSFSVDAPQLYAAVAQVVSLPTAQPNSPPPKA